MTTNRSLLAQIFAPRCPKCGEGKLFRDSLSIVDACVSCGLVLKHHDAADGPTFFSLVVVGFLVIGCVAFVEMHYEPPLWVHAVIWIPFTIVACIVSLRVFKTIFITFEHRLALLKENDPNA